MSIIGTRPPLISETSLYELHHRARLAIKPGITGMWQVSGRSDITDFEEVVLIDKHRQQSPRFLPPIVKNGVNLSVNPVCFLRSVNFYFTDESEPSLVIISEAENRLLFSHLYLSILHRKCNR